MVNGTPRSRSPTTAPVVSSTSPPLPQDALQQALAMVAALQPPRAPNTAPPRSHKKSVDPFKRRVSKPAANKDAARRGKPANPKPKARKLSEHASSHRERAPVAQPRAPTAQPRAPRRPIAPPPASDSSDSEPVVVQRKQVPSHQIMPRLNCIIISSSDEESERRKPPSRPKGYPLKRPRPPSSSSSDSSSDSSTSPSEGERRRKAVPPAPMPARKGLPTKTAKRRRPASRPVSPLRSSSSSDTSQSENERPRKEVPRAKLPARKALPSTTAHRRHPPPPPPPLKASSPSSSSCSSYFSSSSSSSSPPPTPPPPPPPSLLQKPKQPPLTRHRVERKVASNSYSSLEMPIVRQPRPSVFKPKLPSSALAQRHTQTPIAPSNSVRPSLAQRPAEASSRQRLSSTSEKDASSGDEIDLLFPPHWSNSTAPDKKMGATTAMATEDTVDARTIKRRSQPKPSRPRKKVDSSSSSSDVEIVRPNQERRLKFRKEQRRPSPAPSNDSDNYRRTTKPRKVQRRPSPAASIESDSDRQTTTAAARKPKPRSKERKRNSDRVIQREHVRPSQQSDDDDDEAPIHASVRRKRRALSYSSSMSDESSSSGVELVEVRAGRGARRRSRWQPFWATAEEEEQIREATQQRRPSSSVKTTTTTTVTETTVAPSESQAHQKRKRSKTKSSKRSRTRRRQPSLSSLSEWEEALLAAPVTTPPADPGNSPDDIADTGKQSTDVTENVAESKDANMKDPVTDDNPGRAVHGTEWRGVYIEHPPENIFCLTPLDAIPYARAKNPPLTAFDSSHSLSDLYRFVEASHLTHDADEPPESLDELTLEVQAVLEDEAPRILKFWKKKRGSVIRKERNEVQALLEQQRHRRSAFLRHNLKSTKLDLPASVRKEVKGYQLTTRTPEADRPEYTLADYFDEDPYTLVPTEVRTLRPIRPLHRSTTVIGVSKNVRAVPFATTPMLTYDDFDDWLSTESKTSYSAQYDEADEFLLRAIVVRYGASALLFQALKRAGFLRPYKDYLACKKLDEADQWLAKCQEDSAKGMLLKYPWARLARFGWLLRPDREQSLTERLTPSPMLEAAALGTMQSRLGLRSSSDYKVLCSGYRRVFCRMCYKYNCRLHKLGIPVTVPRTDPTWPTLEFAPVRNDENSTAIMVGDSDNEDDACNTDEADAVSSSSSSDSSSSDEFQERRQSARSQTRISSLATANLVMQMGPSRKRSHKSPSTKPSARRTMDASEYVDTSHWKLVQTKVLNVTAGKGYCGARCFKMTRDDCLRDPTVFKLDPPIEGALRKLRAVFGENPCVIATILNVLSCHEVHAMLSTAPAETTADAAAEGKSQIQDSELLTSTEINRDLLRRMKRQRLDSTAWNREYKPCDHEGPCEPSRCSCLRRQHCCESGCGCSIACTNRFQGCRCSRGNCRTNACPCYAALRECDPDLCGNCGANEVAVLLHDQDRKQASSNDLGICGNVSMTRGFGKRLAVGFSTTHGWGAFALEPIKRGDFICEYTGAIISQQEADRRGAVYAKMKLNFMFDLNDDTLVDAIRDGNKSRFINHSSAQPNCRAKIVQINGSHRIGFWAAADVQAGDELFFHYGFQFDFSK